MDEAGRIETRGIELPPPPPTVCPLCGWQELHDDGVVTDPPTLHCDNCLFTGDREALADALVVKAREWWGSLEGFFRHVIETKRGQATIYRLAYGLLDAGIRPKITLELLRRVNETLDYRVLVGELEETALRAARDVADKRMRRGEAKPKDPHFGRRSIEDDDDGE